MNKGIDLNLMTAFEAIFVEGNLSRAGERIGLSQPAMSAALGRLRDMYRDKLFIRSKKGMLPTPRAKQLAEPILQALNLLKSSFREEVGFHPETSNKHFKIAMSDYSELVILPRLTAFFKERAPHLSLTIYHMLPQEMDKALEAGKIDLAVTGQAKEAKSHYQQKIFDDSYMCLVRRNHPLIKKKLTLKQYVEIAHVLYSPLGKGMGVVDIALKKKGFKRKVAFRVPHALAVPLIVESSDLITTLPRRLAILYSTRLDLTMLEPPIPIPRGTVTQYWHQTSHQDPANKWLRGTLVDLCRDF